MKFLCLIIGFLLYQSNLYASCDAESSIDKQSLYKLKRLCKTKIDLAHFQVETKNLIEQGFPEKKAKEIYAYEQIKKVFEKKFVSPLVSAGELFQKIGGSCKREFYKTDVDVLDDVFVVADWEWINKGDVPLIYNEVHFVDAEISIKPFNFASLKAEFVYTSPSFNMMMGCFEVEILRSWGTLKASLPLNGLQAALKVQIALKTRLEEMKMGHTLTILKSDGTLTLFDVIKGE